MPNRRAAIHEFYQRSAPGGLGAVVGSVPNVPTFEFRGPALTEAIITRTDLNGYSSWARNRSAADRAALLDDYFSKVVPRILVAGGVYFRDEGDCIVGLFTTYFNATVRPEAIEKFALGVTEQSYGLVRLTPKTSISSGQVAIFQKRHEVITQDWSAEGEPFVLAARLEAAIESKQHVVMYEDTYNKHFRQSTYRNQSGQPTRWTVKDSEPLQVPGVGAAGGWTRVVRYDYRAV